MSRLGSQEPGIDMIGNAERKCIFLFVYAKLIAKQPTIQPRVSQVPNFDKLPYAKIESVTIHSVEKKNQLGVLLVLFLN